MGKAETLQKIKETEAQIRTAKAAAEQERERVLREARREALDLLDSFRNQAEARYREILTAAESAVAAERERMLAAAREDAGRMSARGKANVDKAVELVLAKFRGAIRVPA
jgi:V/A-type H+/Na+-transporting ATPase subunit G/H